MKQLFKKSILLILCLFSGISHIQAQFTAELKEIKQGVEKSYTVKSNGVQYRYEILDDEANIVVIADPVSNKTAILFPEKKQFQYVDLMSSVGDDPFQAFKHWKKKLNEKVVGTEKIWGFDAVKLEYYDEDQKVFTAWYSGEINFIVKLVNHMAENFYVELTNIQKRKSDAKMFVVPFDYVEVDYRMQPLAVLPPPALWRTIETNLPINSDFVRGDRIIFKVPFSGRYKIALKNKNYGQAKIISTSMKNGVEFPADKIGPISFRTTRLSKDEYSSVSYIGETGDDVVLHVHEGEIHVEISPVKW